MYYILKLSQIKENKRGKTLSYKMLEEQANRALEDNSPQEMEKKVLTLIYQYPVFFGYARLDEDNRSAFLISLHNALPQMLKHYDPKRKGFLSYLLSFTRMYKKSWVRETAKQCASAASLSYCYTIDQGLMDSAYCAEDVCCAETSPDYTAWSQDVSLPKRSEQKIVCQMLVALALKNAMVLSDRQITLIIAITAIKSEIFLASIQKAKESLLAHLEIQKDMIYKRNKAFFLKNKYRIELERLSPDTLQYETVQRKFQYQSRILNAKNSSLNRRVDIAPTNVVIGAIMNLPSRRVTRLLELVRLGRLQKLLKKESLDLEQYGGQFF
jgi:hypothetical protein